MIYFFHHYELPVIIQQAQVQQILRLRTRQRHQQQNGNGAATTNNASNLRNGSNTMGNQANNSNATGGNGGGGVGAGSQVNNSGVGSNNSNNTNNHPLNNHQRTLFAIISLITNVQVVSMLLNSILNAFGVVQGRLINYAFGSAAFSNNNNDNRLNNNNITNNNRGNNPSMNFTRLRINLSRLRRINLAGIQINPIEMNPPERPENLNNDEGDGTNGTGNSSVAATAAAGGDDANGSLPTEVNVATPSSTTAMENDQRDHEISTIEYSRSSATTSSDFDLDFDIIDANAEVTIHPSDLQLNVGEPIADSDPQDGGTFNRHSNALNTVTSIAPTLRCDIQVQSISSLSNCEPVDNVPNDTIDDRSNPLMAFNRSPSNAGGNDDSCYQIRLSKSCQSESHRCGQQQGDNQDNSLSNTKTDSFKAEPSVAAFESADQTNCSLLSALAQKSDAILSETQDSTATATDAHISTNEC